MTALGEAGMVGHVAFEPEAAEPAIGGIEMHSRHTGAAPSKYPCNGRTAASGSSAAGRSRVVLSRCGRHYSRMPKGPRTDHGCRPAGMRLLSTSSRRRAADSRGYAPLARSPPEPPSLGRHGTKFTERGTRTSSAPFTKPPACAQRSRFQQRQRSSGRVRSRQA